MYGKDGRSCQRGEAKLELAFQDREDDSVNQQYINGVENQVHYVITEGLEAAPIIIQGVGHE